MNGTLILDAFRKVGMKVEPHGAYFRHDTPDIEWLAVVGEKKWVVLMRDQKIGRRPLELDALLRAKVKAFVLTTGELKDLQNAKIVIEALEQILEMIRENRFPFIARIHENSNVVLWKFTRGRKRK